MKTFLLAPLILAAFGAAPAFAGGRPVMYVVVDRVETTQDQSSISMIRIWGSFTRAKNPRSDFSKPIDGYIQFGQGSDKESPKWQKATGTGKAVLVGSCAGAGGFETVVIHPANEKPKDDGENVPYPTGHLELFGDMFAGGRDNNVPEVKTLLAFVAAKQKVCPLCRGAAPIVTKNPGPQPIDDAFVGQWTVEFANGVVETCDLVKEGTANVVELKRSCPGKVRHVANGVVELVFDDGRMEHWTKVGQRMVVEHWASSDQFPSGTPVLGIAERAGGRRNDPVALCGREPQGASRLRLHVRSHRAELLDLSTIADGNLGRRLPAPRTDGFNLRDNVVTLYDLSEYDVLAVEV